MHRIRHWVLARWTPAGCILAGSAGGCFEDAATAETGSTGSATASTSSNDGDTSPSGPGSSSTTSNAATSGSASSGSASSGSASSSGSDSGQTCQGELDRCGVCNGQGGTCFGCTISSASNYDPLAEVNDGTCVCNPTGGQALDQSQLTGGLGVGGTEQWQSFTAGLDGGLRRVDLELSSPLGNAASPGTVILYEGEGLGGTELAELEVELAPERSLQQFEFESPVPIAAGQQYTVLLTVPDVQVGFVNLSEFDEYDGGRSSLSPDQDLLFRTFVSSCAPD